MEQNNVTPIKKPTSAEKRDEIILEATAKGLKLLKENLRAEIATVETKLDEHGAQVDATLADQVERVDAAIGELSDVVADHRTTTDKAHADSVAALAQAKLDLVTARTQVEEQIQVSAPVAVTKALEAELDKQVELLRSHFESRFSAASMALDVALADADNRMKAFDNVIELALTAYANIGDKPSIRKARDENHTAWVGETEVKDRAHFCKALKVYLQKNLGDPQRLLADSVAALVAGGQSLPSGWASPPAELDTLRGLRESMLQLVDAAENLRELSLVSKDREAEIDRIVDEHVRNVANVAHITAAMKDATLHATRTLENNAFPVGREPWRSSFDRCMKQHNTSKKHALKALFEATAEAFV